MASATPSWSQSGMTYRAAAFTSAIALPIASGRPASRRSGRSFSESPMAIVALMGMFRQRHSACNPLLIGADGVDLHTRTLARDDPGAHILHTREVLGALGGIDKVKIQLLHGIGRCEKAPLHVLAGRAVGFEIVHVSVHAEALRVIEQLRAVERLAVEEDDREAVEPLERAGQALPRHLPGGSAPK